VRGLGAAVVGAGASGLAAALGAAGVPGGILALEGNGKPGRKLLATGNGRCNLTNESIAMDHYHGDVRSAAPFLNAWPAARVRRAFLRLGLLTRADAEGRVYPHSLQAAAVAEALLSACREQGVSLECGRPVERILPVKGGFLVKSAGGERFARRCVLACGGKASPKHSTGSGYGLARSLGHTVTPLSPSLTGLQAPKKFTRPLKGIRCRARVALFQKGRELCAESGEVIFGDGSVSGICVMNLSARLRELGAEGLELRLDLLEQFSREELRGYLQALAEAHPGRPAGELFSGALNLRLGWELVHWMGWDPDRPLVRLSPQELDRAAGWAKAVPIPVSGPLSWEQAQCTAGGVPLEEVDLETMESRICPGLYLTGELLDLDGDCGGYNLHWAWATGFTAGLAIQKEWEAKA